MPDIDDVLEDAQREIKSIGDNVKSLKDNMEKNLADVGKIAEDAPKAFAASEQFKKDMEALTAGVLEKHDVIALKVKALTDGALKASTERMDDIEKKLNRGRLGGGWGDGDEGRKVAEAFARDAKARRGELKTDFDPDKVDLEEIKSYCKAFPVYLRKDEKGRSQLVMRELHDNIDVKRGISPAAATADNTPFVSQILDMQGLATAEFIILCGALADADAIFTVLAEEGENPALTDNSAVDDRDLLGLETQAGFDFSADNKVFKLGLRPSGKRYKRITITPANNTGNVFLAGLWVTLPLMRPTPNPPV
jgi:hypothetical protein